MHIMCAAFLHHAHHVCCQTLRLMSPLLLDCTHTHTDVCACACCPHCSLNAPSCLHPPVSALVPTAPTDVCPCACCSHCSLNAPSCTSCVLPDPVPDVQAATQLHPHAHRCTARTCACCPSCSSTTRPCTMMWIPSCFMCCVNGTAVATTWCVVGSHWLG